MGQFRCIINIASATAFVFESEDSGVGMFRKERAIAAHDAALVSSVVVAMV